MHVKGTAYSVLQVQFLLSTQDAFPKVKKKINFRKYIHVPGTQSWVYFHLMAGLRMCGANNSTPHKS